MRAGRLGIARPVLRVNHAVILFWVGPCRLAIEAQALKEIRSDRALAAEECGCDAILSAHALLGLPAGPAERLLILRSRRVGVRVDRVERMVETGEARPLPRAFQGAECSWYRGMVLIGESICPLVNPETLAEEATALATPTPASASATENRATEIAAI